MPTDFSLGRIYHRDTECTEQVQIYSSHSIRWPAAKTDRYSRIKEAASTPVTNSCEFSYEDWFSNLYFLSVLCVSVVNSQAATTRPSTSVIVRSASAAICE